MFTCPKVKVFGTSDRQTDILLTGKKVNPDLFVIEKRDMYIYIQHCNLLKSYENIHSMTYITKIMLTGIAIKNTGYCYNMNDCYLEKN